MLLLPPKLSIGVAVLLALFHACAVQGASIRHHRLRGGEQGAYFAPSSDMVKALEYIESLKRRTDGLESPTADYDEVDKFRFLVQLASLQDESAPERGDDGWLESKAPQWVKAMLRAMDQAGENTDAAPPPASRPSKSRQKPAGSVGPGDYGGMVKPHKKYPLMFEDEENVRDSAFKRATEDLEEQYTPQSLANMRSIFEELGKLSSKDQKRDDQKFYSNDDEDEDDDDGMYRVRNLAYEDVAGGEDWVPLEEQVETEEMVKGSHEEFDRGLGDSAEDVETLERRASQDPDDDTKLVDYYLLKVLEMTDQEQKRDRTAGQDSKKRFIRPSLIDPQAINRLKAISLKTQVPPDELIEMLITGEITKQERPVERKPMPRYKGRFPKYYNRRLPAKFPDFKAEDILNLLDSLGSHKTHYNKQSPYKTTVSRFVTPSGHRGSLIMSEMNKALNKRNDDYDDTVDEDELATFLAAKVLTEYPDTENSKRSLHPEVQEQFPYELYEEAMKDYFDQVDTGKSAPVKRDTEAKEEQEPKQLNDDSALEPLDQQTPEPVQEEEKEHRAKIVSGM
ncbi:secretogranin-2b [Sardina pilchardus]|uniref:secretogranin-2b n=1 Tax=Sardina pilchardus TaxID=27697 RepID=UPI002E0F6E98